VVDQGALEVPDVGPETIVLAIRPKAVAQRARTGSAAPIK